MAIVERGLTLDEFLKLPEEEPSLEYFDGVITQKVSPRLRHAILQGALIKLIDQVGLPGKVARAIPELRTTFAGASFVPDVSVLRWERIAVDTRGRATDELFGPPDIAIEIPSPGQSITALVRRCVWYVSHGVSIALLVDPDEETVLAFRPGGQVAVLRDVDRIDLHEVLPEFDLTVEQLFASLSQV